MKVTLIYFGQKPKEWILQVFCNNAIWITLTDATSYNINVWHHSIFSSRLMFWNWNEVQCFADQASIRPHGHRSPDVERIVPGNSRKSRSNTGMPSWWHSWFWKKNMCLSAIDISIVRSPPLEDSSSFIVSISIPYGAPSITIVVLSHLVPNTCRWLVLRYMSTPQTAQYRQKFDVGFRIVFSNST